MTMSNRHFQHFRNFKGRSNIYRSSNRRSNQHNTARPSLPPSRTPNANANNHNPNTISLRPQRHTHTPLTPNKKPEGKQQQQLGDEEEKDSKKDEEQDSHFWSYEDENLMRRTQRSYDLVLNYPRDSNGGQRWSASSIASIRKTGRRLHSDINELQCCKRQLNKSKQANAVGEDEEQDRILALKINGSLIKVMALCETVLSVIKDLERVLVLVDGKFEFGGGGDGKGENGGRKLDSA
ncbi:hypothetical protein GQ44DRAFT_420886 [Phaeosphaeriaceae sp. PMI808]|nr:hypothetical protein GQ44DRAFT_420886 [Phaeosphaeriaceae sp. PMI808]